MSTAAAGSPRIAIYSRQGCELCEEMIAELEFSGHEMLRHFSVIDVDSDEQLVEKYGIDVPVLTIDGDLVCRHRLDEVAVLTKLQKPQ